MSSLHSQNRSSLCRFTFADGRRCRSPRISTSPDFCHYHAKKDARSRATQELSKDLSWFFSGNYLSANDLNTALAHVFIAVARGDIQPRAARTLAYLAQTMFQTLHLAQDEFITACGKSQWLNSISNSIDQNHEHRYPSEDPSPAPPSAPAAPCLPNTGSPAPSASTSADPGDPSSRTASPDNSGHPAPSAAPLPLQPPAPEPNPNSPPHAAGLTNFDSPPQRNRHADSIHQTTLSTSPLSSFDHPQSRPANPSGINTSSPPRNC
jgi:hypothetical protein